MNSASEPVRIVRIIGRLSIGGPSIQAITLTRRLAERGYETALIRGREEPGEGNMDYLADELGVQPVLVPSMREGHSRLDVRALISLVWLIRTRRPEIVHTHAAKAGMLGRLATLIAFPNASERPALIHTYHGHSLTGHFSWRTSSIYRQIERALGRFSDQLIAVSEEVRDDLVSLAVAPASRFEVIPLGLDLAPFAVDDAARAHMREAVRAELGIPSEARLVTLIARLVPSKRVDRFLRVANALRELDLDDVRFLIVGDGELRQPLRDSPEARALDGSLIWAGFRRDMPALCLASDVVVQTSDSEGSPVSLVEAQAAGVPVVSTRTEGASAVLQDGATGFVSPRDPPEAMAFAIETMLKSEELRVSMGRRGRERAVKLFSLDRLVDDLDNLYSRTARGRGR